MFSNPNWFAPRKYGGWGIHPITWQGWLYVAVLIGVAVLLSVFPFINEETKKLLSFVWVGIISLDVIRLMASIKRDEREAKVEALAERNAAWAMVLVLVGGMLYQILILDPSGERLDPVLFITLLMGALVKTLTHVIMNKKTI